ncbi:HPP family protein [Niveispirillum sp. BGYR6]|uniref:HPP family protein n=1 Tax=Niveispirillum sp. BGYR6 TaxID=2971249 RepID=UPI0022B9C893|nr:HPP family protein [Niveispirillum sp. BGYR6]
MRHFITRHQPAQPWRVTLLAGLGGLLAIGCVAALSSYMHAPLLIAPFGASCVLLFAAPNSPLSQPAHVVGGHVLATAIGLLLHAFLPNEWWAVALAVGLSIALMNALRVTHPPAGADPLLVFALSPGLDFLLVPVLAGACMLVTVAVLFHRASGVTYPARPV